MGVPTSQVCCEDKILSSVRTSYIITSPTATLFLENVRTDHVCCFEFVVSNKKTISLYFALGICPQKYPAFKYCSICLRWEWRSSLLLLPFFISVTTLADFYVFVWPKSSRGSRSFLWLHLWSWLTFPGWSMCPQMLWGGLVCRTCGDCSLHTGRKLRELRAGKERWC